MYLGLGLGLNGIRAAAAAPSLAALWTGGETGFQLDAFAAGALYQDPFAAAGDTLADDAGEPVGLLLDRKAGAPVLGSELRGSVVADRVGATNTPATYNASTGEATCHRVSSGDQSFVKLTGLEVGGIYRIEIAVSAGSASSVTIRQGSATGSNPGSVVSIGTTYAQYMPVAASSSFFICASGTGLTASFTVVSIKHLPGRHAIYGGGTSARPPVAVNGGKRHLAWDLVNDSMSVYLPAGQTGTLIVAGATKTLIEDSVTRAAGNMVFGPTTVAGAVTANVLSQIGHMVGALYTSRNLSAGEKTSALAYYTAQGASSTLLP